MLHAPKIVFFVLTIVFHVACFNMAFAAPLENDNPEAPWHITADEIHQDKKTSEYIAKGNVIISKTGRQISADFIRFDQKNMKVYARGHVMMSAGQDLLTGQRIDMDLDRDIGTLYNGTVFLSANHYYIKGDRIEKIGKDSYAAHKAAITTCDGDKPAWRVTGRKFKVTIDGYGYATNAVLWTSEIPVLYTPFIFFPAKAKRQTGFLQPQIGQSNRKREEFILPFFWAINDQSDATFYEHYMGLRGDKFGVEYRYVLSDKSRGTLMYDFLRDKKADSGSPPGMESEYQYHNQNWAYFDDSVSRPNADRYWFRMKSDQEMPFGFWATLDLDIVSDQDYLHEFKDGYTGFYETERYYNKKFNRDIEEYDDAIRTNSLKLNKAWDRYTFNASTIWYDDVIIRRKTGTGMTTHQLPSVSFNAATKKIGNSPFYSNLASTYIHSYQRLGQKKQRAEFYPKFTLPHRVGNYFTIEPFLELRETLWHVDDANGAYPQDILSRELYNTGLHLSSNVFRIYQVNGKNVDKVKHAITPSIQYSYIPTMDQRKYPDIITKQNLLTYTLTSTLTSRSKTTLNEDSELSTDSATKQTEKNKQKDSKTNLPAYSYNQFCYLSLSQSYDLNEAKENIPANRSNKDKKQPFLPVTADIILSPMKYLSIQADASRSLYESFYRTHNTRAVVSDNRGNTLSVEHRYTHNSSESIATQVTFELMNYLKGFAEYERDLYNHENVTHRLGLLYRKQCWSVEFNYVRSYDNEEQYTFTINFHGLGAFGKSLGRGDIQSLRGDQEE